MKSYLGRVLMYRSTCQPVHLLLFFGSPLKGFFFCVNNIQLYSLQNLTARAVLCQGTRSSGQRATTGRCLGLLVASMALQSFLDAWGREAVALSACVRCSWLSSTQRGAGVAGTVVQGRVDSKWRLLHRMGGTEGLGGWCCVYWPTFRHTYGCWKCALRCQVLWYCPVRAGERQWWQPA